NLIGKDELSTLGLQNGAAFFHRNAIAARFRRLELRVQSDHAHVGVESSSRRCALQQNFGDVRANAPRAIADDSLILSGDYQPSCRQQYDVFNNCTYSLAIARRFPHARRALAACLRAYWRRQNARLNVWFHTSHRGWVDHLLGRRVFAAMLGAAKRVLQFTRREDTSLHEPKRPPVLGIAM